MYNGFIVKDYMRNGHCYDGTTLKFGITVDNKNYFVKFMKESISSLYSEYIASRFIQRLGISCHNVYFGFYNNQLVNIIEDFTKIGEHLKAYKAVGQYYEDTDISIKTYTYEDVLDMIQKHRKLSDFNKDKMLKQFWDMFICDAIVGNRDRNTGNWGYITDGKAYRPAPVYDNGGSLFPGVAECINDFYKDKRQFVTYRAEKFPASLFQIQDKQLGRPRRTNYYEILKDLRFNRILAIEVKSLRNKVGFEGIFQTIVSVVSEVAKFIPKPFCEFYVYIVCVRYLHMIERLDENKAFDIVEKRLSNGKNR